LSQWGCSLCSPWTCGWWARLLCHNASEPPEFNHQAIVKKLLSKASVKSHCQKPLPTARWVQPQGALYMITSALSSLLLILLSLLPLLFRNIRHMHANATSSATKGISAAACPVKALPHLYSQCSSIQHKDMGSHP
jgi:hypothetical protein